MVKEGYYFGVPPLALGGVSFLLHWYVAAAVLVLLAAFVFSFFRDPERMIPSEPGAVVSPGDGRVVVVTDEENAGKPGKRVSIFLAVWNVHVNRSPVAGTITNMEYRPGKFLAAMRERASVENEQNVFTLSTEAGEMVFKQIAGLIARRVVSWKNLDGSRRNGFQADCGFDRPKGSLLEEAGGEGGSRREDWTGTIRVAGGRVGPERGQDTGEAGGKCERRIERARAVARETRSG